LGLPAGLVPWGVDGNGRVLVAVAVVLGHVWPVSARFRGGKGVATLVGGALGLDPVLGLLAVAVHLGIKRLTGFVSLASVILAWSLPLAQLLLRAVGSAGGRFVAGTGTLTALALLVTLRHRANFVRMRAGTEDRYDDPDHVAHGMSERDGEGRSPR
jgi:glycerol-3-phosphate acyltransferase PlsY